MLHSIAYGNVYFWHMALNDPLSIQHINVEASPATSEAVEDLLKEHYYRVDPAEYFERRLWGIIALAELEPGSIKWDPKDTTSLFGQFKAILRDKKFALDVPPGTTLNSKTMASIESYTLMQHVIETALRLFVAGQERVTGNSPMTTLLNMRQAADLREPIKPLLGARARNVVESVMFPAELHHEESEHSKQLMRRHLDFLTAWLTFFARFYSEGDFNGAQGNNQLKHGATTSPRDDLAVALHLADAPPKSLSAKEWSDASAIINAEAITYVMQHRAGSNKIPGLILRTDNSDPATNLGISQVGISIVRSLWQMSRVVAYPLTEGNYDFDYSPMPDELFAATTKPPRSIMQTLLQASSKPKKQSVTARRKKLSGNHRR
ncbi:hypothetical protein SAMN04489742_2080 [Arthrobacter crystallopoietes]|uniref:Uncharacterized protein n=2 Tax=Crystallibacter crystallopoietes TaxID=37928 RepID=A0A1H1CU97_9MICC|nr:hypothetical protein AC20117_06995 [Arthrobacter crystallopoietes]SDQ67488.1 hypothetical protein SAMN04489742_2080 [Arthrobacter crystallopoietes]